MLRRSERTKRARFFAVDFVAQVLNMGIYANIDKYILFPGYIKITM